MSSRSFAVFNKIDVVSNKITWVPVIRNEAYNYSTNLLSHVLVNIIYFIVELDMLEDRLIHELKILSEKSKRELKRRREVISLDFLIVPYS